MIGAKRTTIYLLSLGLIIFILSSVAVEIKAAPPGSRVGSAAPPRVGTGGGGGGGGFDPNCPWLTVGGSVEATGVTKIFETDSGDSPCFPGMLKYKNATGQEFVRKDYCDGPDLSVLKEYYFLPLGQTGEARIHDYFCTNGCTLTQQSNLGYCKP